MGPLILVPCLAHRRPPPLFRSPLVLWGLAGYCVGGGLVLDHWGPGGREIRRACPCTPGRACVCGM